jgi:hypothetical protein
VRYELDRLGWLNFEWLIQTWLKVEFGFTVEAWGGTRDLGRDAYAEESVASTSNGTLLKGPVVFQAKFVAQANARGSDYKTPLLAACKAEAKAIRRRVDEELWVNPSTYVLLTNCTVTSEDRKAIGDLLSRTTSACVHVLGAGDLASTLDLHPEIARSFPQILSYQNLLELLSRIQAKDVFERSAAALAGAQEIIPVFVPTEAYDRAWAVIRSKHFVVLSGPPEMGKTSIGWMIAMSQIANGWQAIECNSPADVFRVYESKEKQVFIADDAFGRTEFDVNRGTLWEIDLAKVLQRLDKDHLLIWTSRKHILERAIREIDLQGKAAKFPAPGEVLVQADRLSTKEKALILYRHAAALSLDETAKTILKSNVELIVGDRHFTPERIRRFVRFELPSLADEMKHGVLKREDLSVRVEKALEQYTEMMEKSFLKLPEEQKWILVCLLDERGTRSPDKIAQLFKIVSPVNNSKPIKVLLDELEEAFIRIVKISFSPFAESVEHTYIEWVHPSYRDLVIDALSTHRSMRLRYIEFGGVAAITLALSQQGGATGKRDFPLLPDEESWKALCDASVLRIKNDPISSPAAILSVVESALSEAKTNQSELRELASIVCEACQAEWDEHPDQIDTEDLRRFYELAELSSRHVPSPGLDSIWEDHWDKAREILYEERERPFKDPEEFTDWAELLNLIQKNDPRYLRRTGFLAVSDDAISRAIKYAEVDADMDLTFDEADEYREEAERLRRIAKAFGFLKEALPKHADAVEGTIAHLEAQIDRMDERAFEMRSSSDDTERDTESSGVEVFNLAELFADL